MMDFFITLIGCIFDIYIANLFFSKFGKKKLSGFRHFSFCVLILFLQTISSYYLNGSSFVFLTAILIMFIFSNGFTLKIYTKIVLSVVFSIIMALSETIVVIAATLGTNVEIAQLQSNIIMYIICILLAKFLSFAIVKMIKIREKLSSSFSTWFLGSIIILPFSSIFVILILYRYSFLINTTSFKVSMLISTILLIIANILIFYIVDKQEDYIKTKERLAFAENHIQTQLAHYTELYEQQEELKKFRHDSKNLYILLLSKLESLPTEQAIMEVKEKMNLVYNTTTEPNSGNPIIDSIISAKIVTAKKLGINIATKIRAESNIKIDELEIGVLLGNALDNAIEATSLIENKNDINIDLNVICAEEAISIHISNPTAAPVNTNDLKSTKSDKQNHGYGISGIRAITEKYNGVLSITSENNIFYLRVTIPNHKTNPLE